MQQSVLRDSAQALPPPRAFPGAQRSPRCHPTAFREDGPVGKSRALEPSCP